MFVSLTPCECSVPWHIFWLWQLDHVDRMIALAMHRQVCRAELNENRAQIPHRPTVVNHSMVRLWMAVLVANLWMMKMDISIKFVHCVHVKRSRQRYQLFNHQTMCPNIRQRELKFHSFIRIFNCLNYRRMVLNSEFLCKCVGFQIVLMNQFHSILLCRIVECIVWLMS